MTTQKLKTIGILLICVAAALAASGGATSVAQWIVQTRNHQGDVALTHRNFPDASVAYQLALKIDPANRHARDGLTNVQIRLAQTYFVASRFDEAIDALAVASKYSPNDERVQSLRNAIEQAEIKRDIVLSNYPSYKVTGASIQRAYALLRTQAQEIATMLKRFDYTYDTADLSTAIRQSTVLSEDVARLTSRLIQYRQLVESGVAEQGEKSLAPPASLLPLP
jgi:tetratricopeptide (TPR) repeat protein